MPTRKLFADFAHGLVGAFISRNNDTGGLWAVGVLAASGVRSVSYDLAETSDPFALASSRWLHGRVVREQIPPGWIAAARLGVSVGRAIEPPPDDVTRPAWDAGITVNRVVVAAELVDDRGREWRASGTTWCWDAGSWPSLRRRTGCSTGSLLPPGGSGLGR